MASSDSTSKFAFVLLNLVLLLVCVYIIIFEFNITSQIDPSSPTPSKTDSTTRYVVMLSAVLLAIVAFIGLCAHGYAYVYSGSSFDGQFFTQTAASSPRIFVQSMKQSRVACGLMLIIIIIFIFFTVLSQEWLSKYEAVSKKNKNDSTNCLTFSTGSLVTFSSLSLFILYALLGGLFLLALILFVKGDKSVSLNLGSVVQVSSGGY